MGNRAQVFEHLSLPDLQLAASPEQQSSCDAENQAGLRVERASQTAICIELHSMGAG